MNYLILMRHGQSLWNRANIFTGWVDIPLSSKGIDEALTGGEQIAHLPIDVVFISKLTRAESTAFLALSKHHSKKTPVLLHPGEGKIEEWAKIYSDERSKETIPVYAAWELNERYYGELQGKNKQEMRDLYGDEQVKIWRRSYDVPPPGGESLKMTSERTLPYFNSTVVPHLKEGKNVFISAHGNSLRSIIMELDGLDEQQVVSLEIPTGKPLLYAYDGKEIVKVDDIPR
jgi:2,3-bisphosphoglycerate-dependent phosphoglycerate mutase